MDLDDALAEAWETLGRNDVAGGSAQLAALVDSGGAVLTRSDDALDEDVADELIQVGYAALEVGDLHLVHRIAELVSARARASIALERELPAALTSLSLAAHLGSWASILARDAHAGLVIIDAARRDVEACRARVELDDPFVNELLDGAEAQCRELRHEARGGESATAHRRSIVHMAKHAICSAAMQPGLRRRARQGPAERRAPPSESTVAFEAIVAMREDASRYFQLSREAYDLQDEASSLRDGDDPWGAHRLSCRASDIREAQLKAIPASLLASRHLCYLLSWQLELVVDLLRPATALAIAARYAEVAADQLARHPLLASALADSLYATQLSLQRLELPPSAEVLDEAIGLTATLDEVAPGRQPNLRLAVNARMIAAMQVDRDTDPQRYDELVNAARSLIDAQRRHTPRDPSIRGAERLCRAVLTFTARTRPTGDPEDAQVPLGS